MDKNREYWNAITKEYQKTTQIATDDFHFGPLMPGDKALNLLPADLKGKKCLEIGCGAAQNSIYLAKQGADCTAFDISEEQIRHADSLMKREGVNIALHCTSMDNPEEITGEFDFIHSVYSISFSKAPAKVVEFAADHLRGDGCFLLSTGHPLAQCEWLELEGEHGIFMPDYFNIPPDIRYDENDKEEIRSKTYPLSVIARWISDAGMCIEGLFEPSVHSDDIKKSPYYSEKWKEYTTMFGHVPAVVIFICRKV
jgi:SAM-dependent methyltransferase